MATKDEREALGQLALKMYLLTGDIKRQAEAVTDPVTRRRLLALVERTCALKAMVEDLRGADGSNS
jgi:hypothetical protein